MNVRKLILPLLFIGLIGVVAGCQEADNYAGGEPEAQESEVDFATAVDANRQAITQAVAQGDVAAAAAVYTADAIFYGGDGNTNSGTEGIVAVFQGLFEAGFNAATLEPMETIQHGDLGWEISGHLHRAIGGRRLDILLRRIHRVADARRRDVEGASVRRLRHARACLG